MKAIQDWNNLTNKITEQFIFQYFELELDEELEWFWIADEVGGVFEFSDYYFNFSDVLNCYKHNITKEQLFGWYEHNLTEPYVKISLSKFIISPEKRLENEQKSLQKTKQNLTFAQEEFNKALKQHNK